MSTVIMAACWPLQMDVSAKAVLIALADNANDAGYCWPSIETIAKRTCLHRANVIKAIERLESMRHISVDRSNGRHSTYTVTPNLDLFDANPSRSATGSGARPVAERDRSRSATRRGARPVIDANQKLTDTGSGARPVAERDSNQEQDQKKDQEQKQPPAKKPPAAREPMPEIPEWIDRDAWAGFEQMRRRQRFPLTARAAALVIRKLGELREHGHDPTAVLDQSTRNAWRDVYPIKQDSQNDGSSKPSLVQRAEADLRGYLARNGA